MLIHFIHGYYCIYRLWQPLTYLYFPYHCISLIYFSFTKIRMFLYAQIYWLAEFGDVSCLQFNYLRVETLTPTWEDLVGHLSDNLVGHLSVWSPTKLSVRPECLIVDTLGGICSYCKQTSSQKINICICKGAVFVDSYTSPYLKSAMSDVSSLSYGKLDW